MILFQISTYIIYFENRILDKGLSVNNKLFEAIWNYICYDYSYNLVKQIIFNEVYFKTCDNTYENIFEIYFLLSRHLH